MKVLDGAEATEEFTQARFEFEMDGRPLRPQDALDADPVSYPRTRTATGNRI